MEDAVETLRNGGIVVIAPQATRLPYLKEPGIHDIAMALLIRGTTKAGVNDFGILPVGFSIKGITDYMPHSGLNVGVRYKVDIGSLWLKNAALQSAKKAGWTLDKWTFERLKELLPPDYPKIPPCGDIYRYLYE